MAHIEGETGDKVNAFLKSFDDNSCVSISKDESLIFYDKLFDNIIENDPSLTRAKKQ